MKTPRVLFGTALYAMGCLVMSQAAMAIPMAGLISLWQAEGNALDSGPAGNDGTLKNGATFAPGKVGQAFSFDGINDGVALGNPATLQLNAAFTFGGWIKRGNLATGGGGQGTEGEILTYGQNGYAFGFDAASGNDQLFLSKTGVSIVYSGLTITDLDFHYVAVTKSGNQVVFYVDGVASAPINYDPGFAFTTDLAIGARGDHLDPVGSLVASFHGSIDELAVWNRALSQTEIQGIVGEANSVPEPSALVLFGLGLGGLLVARRRKTVRPPSRA